MVDKKLDNTFLDFENEHTVAAWSDNSVADTLAFSDTESGRYLRYRKRQGIRNQFIDRKMLLLMGLLGNTTSGFNCRFSPKNRRSQRAQSCCFLLFMSCIILQGDACTDLGDQIRDGATYESCINYDPNENIFDMSCSFAWPSNGGFLGILPGLFGETDDSGDSYCIVLSKNEIFEGNGHAIILDELTKRWNGFIQISDSDGDRPTSLQDAPIVRNLHMKGGNTANEGGFIVRPYQKNFIIESCSSSGDIEGRRSGGICGQGCTGNILIANCSSSGEISGEDAGGIVGQTFGINGARTAHIILSQSVGVITGRYSGGICGSRTAENRGVVSIRNSHSKGSIDGEDSGGICGWNAGINQGEIDITQCYSEGDITGDGGGGIMGSRTASNMGIVDISNSYSRGHITGEAHTGGVCGRQTGIDSGVVRISNAYASGSIIAEGAGGVIGHISDAAAEVTVTMSVYNGAPMVGGIGNLETFFGEKNSWNLTDITSQIYCYENGECWDSERIWKPVEETFPVLRPLPSSQPTVLLPPSPAASIPSVDPIVRIKTLSPTWSSTSSKTSSSTNSQTSIPISTSIQSTLPSPTPSITRSSTFSVIVLPSAAGTRTFSPTGSFTFSKTSGSTNSQTSTPVSSMTSTVPPSRSLSTSISTSATPSSTETKPQTASRTSSRTPAALGTPVPPIPTILPTNDTRTVMSACGSVNVFNCMSVVFKNAIEVSSSFLSTESASTGVIESSTFTVQSGLGSTPQVSFRCEVDSDDAPSEPIECSEELTTGYKFPFYATSEMISSTICDGRLTTGMESCRHFEYVVNIQFRNQSHTASFHERRFTDEEALRFGLMTQLSLDDEVLLIYRQPVIFRPESLDEDTGESSPSAIYVSPKKYIQVIERDINAPNQFNISVRITGRSDLLIVWAISSELSLFIETPANETVATSAFPARIVSEDKLLTMRKTLMQRGINSGNITLTFLDQQNVVSTRELRVNVTVHEANLRVGQSTIDVSRSSTEDEVFRQISLSNEGEHAAQWSSQLFLLTENGETQQSIPWLIFPSHGRLSAPSEDLPSLKLFPALTPGLGIFQALILIETDAWTGDIQDIRNDLEGISIPDEETLPVSFWIHIRLTVSSIFVCQQFSSITSLIPQQRRVMPVRVVNTEAYPIILTLNNFTIAPANRTSFQEEDSNHAENVHIDPQTLRVVRNVIRPTMWWTVTPARLSLRRGTSGQFRMDIAYTDRQIVPQDFRFSFVIEVFFEEDNGSPEGTVDTEFGVAFVPGSASPRTSTAKLNATEGTIGETLILTVEFLDIFGNGPAKAILDSTLPIDLPSLSIKTTSVGFPLHAADVSVLTRRGTITSVDLAIELKSEGQIELDMRLANESITGCPMRISGLSIQCDNAFEEPDTSGEFCLCNSGYYRSPTETCIPCPPGTFSSSPSNTESCQRCSNGFFAETGEAFCSECPSSGAKCDKGVIMMKEGHWCELCSLLESPRDSIIQQLRNGDNELFHSCIPPESCVVNSTSFRSECAKGYAVHGPVCDTCEHGFIGTETGECTACGNEAHNVTIFIIGLAVILAAITAISVLSYREVLSERTSISEARELSESNSIRERAREDVDTAITVAKAGGSLERALQDNLVSVKHIIVLLIDYLQILFVLQTLEISPFPKGNNLVEVVTGWATLNPGQSEPFQCSVQSDPLWASVITMLSPIVILSVTCVIQTVTTLSRRRCQHPFPWSLWMSSFARSSVFLMNLVHMSVTKVALEVLDVHPIRIDGKERSSIDLTITTDSSRYRLLEGLAIASLITFVIGYPLTTILYRTRLYMKAQTTESLEKFMKSTGDFRANGFGFLWESVTLIRKIALLLVVSFVSGPVPQLTWVTTIFVISIFILAILMPYRKHSVNYLQYFMIFICVATVFFGFLMRLIRDGEAELSDTQALSNSAITLQGIFLLLSGILGISMVPKATKAAWILILAKLTKLKRWNKRVCGCNKSLTVAPAAEETIK